MEASWTVLRRKAGDLSALVLGAKPKLWLRRLRAVLAGWAAQEERRFILLVPCLLAAGSASWLAMDERPAAWLLLLLTAVAGGAWLAALRQHRDGVLYGARLLACFLAGMTLVALRTAAVDAPVVPPGLQPVTVTGILAEVELREKDRRYTIDVEDISWLGPDETPARVRVLWRGDPGVAKPGDRVRLRASLTPPPGPAMPGGYDFAQGMFYERIGGVGFSYQPARVLEPGGTGLRPFAERLRSRVADRAQSVIGGTEGALAAALMTGKRERIPEGAVDDLRDAGLAHLLAISGLHMGLVCGFLFWSLRYALSWSETLALRFPIKKWAALGALLGGGFYLMLSGGAWSAQRAFIMAAIVFLAMLFDRRGISLRNAAIAAIVIIVLRPEAVVSPGFQMSFAAVVTLIAAFSWIEERFPRGEDRSALAKVSGFMGGLALTSFLAGLATAPFALFHFGRLASFGLIGNMLAMPVITLAVMPAMVLSMFLMPVGLDGPVLVLVGQGLRFVLAIADWTAGLPGAVRHVPMLAPAGFVAAVAGLFTMALLRAPWRLCGLAPLALALPLGLSGPQPDIFVSRDLRNVGVRIDEGGASLALLSKRRDRFTVGVWLTALARPAIVGDQARIEGCGEGICFYDLAPGRLAIAAHRAELEEACRNADIVILRARGQEGDAERCGGRLLALSADGSHPAASLTRTSSGWRLRLAGE